MVLSAAPQGEYGRRLSVLTDRFGKITAFAQAAAKPKSHLLGLTLPMTCAEFTLSRGKTAWNLHGARLIASFSPALSKDYERSCLGMYFLELLSLFSQEGMEEEEAKKLLNLGYLALSALSGGIYEEALGKETGDALVRALYELRLLVIEGEYTELPLHSVQKGAEALWRHAAGARLSALFEKDILNCTAREKEPALSDTAREREVALSGTVRKKEPAVKNMAETEENRISAITKEDAAAFIREVGALYKRLVPYKFNSLEVLRGEG